MGRAFWGFGGPIGLDRLGRLSRLGSASLVVMIFR